MQIAMQFERGILGDMDAAAAEELKTLLRQISQRIDRL